MPADTICFVISPIGEPDSPVRKRSDQVLKYIIKPAAEECGFTTLRADEIPQPGIITSQVIQHIIEADMVVADLTGRNPNVFYELAIRHAIRRPYVQLIDQNEPLPFDVAGIRTIQFNYQDLESADFAKSEIIKQMRHMMGTDTEIQSPITAAIDLSTLRRSANPQDRHFGELLTAMSEIKQQLSSLQRPVTVPASLAASSPYFSGGISPATLAAIEEAAKDLHGIGALEGTVAHDVMKKMLAGEVRPKTKRRMDQPAKK